jgi:CheY-like chemotaxis protein
MSACLSSTVLNLLGWFRNHPRFQHTAIIFVSAVALTDSDRVKGYSYGAVDYLLVPVVPELLRAKVRVFADLFRKTRELERLNAELERRVEERTAELTRANAELERRVEAGGSGQACQTRNSFWWLYGYGFTGRQGTWPRIRLIYNILLVDDQPAKLLSYAAILQDLGENLITAGSAREALEQLLKQDIAIVLSDVYMPELDGFELAGMIRDHPRFQQTAIIFVSAVALTDPDRIKG